MCTFACSYTVATPEIEVLFARARTRVQLAEHFHFPRCAAFHVSSGRVAPGRSVVSRWLLFVLAACAGPCSRVVVALCMRKCPEKRCKDILIC